MYNNKKAHVHFVGIGGIGMSGIATILHHQGYTVSGCDSDLEQHSIKNLQALGCRIHQENNTPSCHDTSINILVYSSAIKAHDTEILAAQQRGIPTIPRALMLAELMRTKYSIAIAGAHGKTTTTSLISHILMVANMDPTIIIGGHLKNISTNAQWGKGEFLVAEADESDRSLTRLFPTLAVITNIDLEHLETYTDLEDIKDTFKQFLNNIPFYGKAIVCIDDVNVRSLLPIAHIKTIKYGLDDNADIFAHDVVLHTDHSTFTVLGKEYSNPLGTIHFSMPGRHNVLNALAAITVSLDLGIDFSTIALALQTFKGIERRFSYCGLFKGAEVFDDYGHHPQEIANTFLVARKRCKKRFIVVFQPHRYTRTDKLWDEFIRVIAQSPLDHLIITDIYPASELPIANITSQNMVKALQSLNLSFPVHYAPYQESFTEIIKHLELCTNQDDLVLLQGAGKINKLGKVLTQEYYFPTPSEAIELKADSK